MGYIAGRRTLHLVFAGESEWAGLELKVRTLSLGEFYAFLGAADPLTEADDDQEAWLGGVEGKREPLIVWWNVQRRGDDGDVEDVPVSRAEVLNLDTALVKAIKRTYIDNMATIPEHDPLAWSSTSGGLAAALQLPAEPLVELPESSTK